MRIYLTASILLGVLAGCSAPQDPATTADNTSTNGAHPGYAGAAFTSRAPMSSFASLPDRGELLAYQKGRQVKHRGAYTAYPVALSEAHALNAMHTGEMVINAPNGEPIRLKYERHEEGKDGNWTWIGRNVDGASAVITFGEKAVFGVIPQGATESLRLTMSAGQSWLVQTDRSKLAGVGGEPHREGGDQLLPPDLASADAIRVPSSMQAAPATAAASASASTAVVDVLLGYTPGMVTKLKSESAVITRLVNMIAITNDAYTNSGVSMRVRLVKTLKVNYPDNTDNGDALEKLTGYKAGPDGGPITPDPAFDELRDMRDEVGADLVSLVRAFQTPENNGCGIAWLIGSGQRDIKKEDEPFGYSVVSDGDDVDEEDGYIYGCRQETLAHELGHNMGQAHNKEDSRDDNGDLSYGTHKYSFGYRESSATGFYTVMAYPKNDADQFSIRYFANPGVKYKKRATGVANESDNVRSMNLTMPVVSQFRSTVVPLSRVISDFNGDGKSDILWRNFSSGRNRYWSAAKSTSGKELASVDNLKWFVAGIGDFSGDGKADILWRNKNTDQVVLWRDGRHDKRVVLKNVSYSKWKVAGIGDFSGDGKDDILWRSNTTGENVYWSAANSSARAQLYTLESKSWVVAGVGDFNADGRSDILWRNTASGKNVFWNGGVRSQRVELETQPDMSWKVVGVGDFNGDGKADVLWRNAGQERNRYWSAGVRSNGVELATTASSWSVAQIADFDGDGISDILWHNTNGNNVYWSAGKQSNRKVLGSVPDTSWRIVP